MEQTRILDGDHGLGGEILDQLNLLLGERADLLAVDDDHADQLILLEHRDEQKRAGAGKFGDGFVWVFRSNVGNGDDLFCADNSIKAGGICSRSMELFIKCRKLSAPRCGAQRDGKVARHRAT